MLASLRLAHQVAIRSHPRGQLLFARHVTASAALRERRSEVNPQAEGEFLSNFHSRRELNWRCLPALLNRQGVHQRPHAANVSGLCGALFVWRCDRELHEMSPRRRLAGDAVFRNLWRTNEPRCPFVGTHASACMEVETLW